MKYLNHKLIIIITLTTPLFFSVFAFGQYGKNFGGFAKRGMRVSTGSYVGDGVADKAITGIGFQPDVIIIKCDCAANAAMRTSAMAGDNSKDLYSTNTALVADLIKTITTNGFTLGVDARVNTNTSTYHWVAFKASAGQLEVGSYTGDGNPNRNLSVLTFQPDFLIISPAANKENCFLTSSMAADDTHHFAGGFTTGQIQALQATGFQVGTSALVNTAAATYYYVAFKSVTGKMAVGSYTGDGADSRNITGVGFQPTYTIVVGGANSATHKSSSTGAATDMSMVFNSANSNDKIQALQSNGFQVGTDAKVNTGATVYYWMSFK